MGYEDVAVLHGGYGAWRAAELPVEKVATEARNAFHWVPARTASFVDGQADPFLSSLEDQSFLQGKELPFQRDLTVLFVDMVDSTPLVMNLDPPEVLKLVQRFMETVADVGVLHCGDVHDFEGDGALLYFEGAGEALPAAFEMRERLVELHEAEPRLPLPRISLDHGRVVVGMVGSRFRRGVGLIGPCVPRASRILKLAPPGGIVATEVVIELARESSPDLYRAFHFMTASESLRGIDETVRIHLAELDRPDDPEEAKSGR